MNVSELKLSRSRPVSDQKLLGKTQKISFSKAIFKIFSSLLFPSLNFWWRAAKKIKELGDRFRCRIPTMPTRAKKNYKQASTELENWLLDEENRLGSYSPSVENDDLPSLSQTWVRWRWPNFLKSRIISKAIKFTAIFTSGILFAL
jgi:hypothetical protein